MHVDSVFALILFESKYTVLEGTTASSASLTWTRHNTPQLSCVFWVQAQGTVLPRGPPS